jgi:hypothetical protein
MTDEQDKQLPIDAVHKDPNPSKDDEKLSKAAMLLSNLQQGWKVSVHRIAPSWARSHLETFDIMDGSEPIDIDYLIKRWGGQCLSIAIHDEHGHWVTKATIPAYSFPPRVYGEPICETQVMGFGSPSPPPIQVAPNQTVERYNPQQNAAAGLLGGLGMSLPELLKMMQGSSKAESTLLLKLFERQLMQQPAAAPAPAPAAPSQSPIKMMRDMMEMQMMMKEMGEQFGFSGGGGGGEDDPLGSLGPLLSTLAQNFMNRPATQKRTQRRPQQRRPPARVMPPLPPQQSVNPQARELPPENQQFGNMDPGEPEQPNLRKLSDSLCDLSAEDSADVVLSAFDSMPESKREAAMTAFFQKMQGGDVDDLTNSDDDYSQDDYPTEYDQTPQPTLSDPYDQTQDPRRSVPTTKGDDPPNRQGD